MTKTINPKVTLIQGKDGQVRRVRVDATEIAVMHAGPTLINGKMGVSMTLIDIDLTAEAAVEDDAAGA